MDQRPTVIVDYDMGNLYSVQQACVRVGLNAKLASTPEDIALAVGVILPGVGAFGEAMRRLGALGLVEPLRDHARAGRPFLGICLGMQLMMSESEEFGVHAGLGLVPGRVQRFPFANGRAVKVPQIQWNQVAKPRETRLLAGVEDGAYMYFLHSFYVRPEEAAATAGVTRYGGIDYCSALEVGNIMGTQFHPEKSLRPGLRIIENFKQIIAT